MRHTIPANRSTTRGLPLLKLALGLLANSWLTGCTTQLNAVRVTDPGDIEIPVAGAPYNLTFTQYEVTVTRRVAACERKEEDQPPVPALVMAVDAKATSKERRDPNRTYVIDLHSLQSRAKTSDVVVEYHPNGAIKSINAVAEDRTPQIIGSTVVSLGKIVTAFAGAAAGATKEVSVCKDDTKKALTSIKSSEGKVNQTSQRVQKLTEELDGMTKVAAIAGAAWGKEERRRHADKMKELQREKDELTAHQEELARLLKSVSVVDTFTWPLNGTTFQSDHSLVKDISEEQIRKWASIGKPELAKLQQETRIFAALESDLPISDNDSCTPKCRDDGQLGLKYRMPAPGRLLVCTAPTCGQDSVAAKVDGNVSQLGRVFTLPLKSGLFSGKKSIVAEFNEAGQPTKLGAKTEIAGGEAAATTFGTFTDSFIAARKAVVPTELERVKAQTELLKANKELADAKKALEPPANEETTVATQAFTADTALLQARLANLQARQALDAAEKGASK